MNVSTRLTVKVSQHHVTHIYEICTDLPQPHLTTHSSSSILAQALPSAQL